MLRRSKRVLIFLSLNILYTYTHCLKKNLNAARPSEHPPVRGKNVKTFRWDHGLFWCPCMAITVSVEYNGGFLPDIILLTLCDYIGEPFRYHEEFLSLQPMFLPKHFDNFSPEGGCSEGLDAFSFFKTRHWRWYRYSVLSWDTNMPRKFCPLAM